MRDICAAHDLARRFTDDVNFHETADRNCQKPSPGKLMGYRLVLDTRARVLCAGIANLVHVAALIVTVAVLSPSLSHLFTAEQLNAQGHFCGCSTPTAMDA